MAAFEKFKAEHIALQQRAASKQQSGQVLRTSIFAKVVIENEDYGQPATVHTSSSLYGIYLF
jgi:hypothetical protein